MWTHDGSKACDEGRHRDCDGVAVFIEQDGPQRYRCGCYCHRLHALDGEGE
jgi:hypothetical protein